MKVVTVLVTPIELYQYIYLDKPIVGQLNTLPTLVPVHGVVSSGDSGNAPKVTLTQERKQVLNVADPALGRSV